MKFNKTLLAAITTLLILLLSISGSIVLANGHGGGSTNPCPNNHPWYKVESAPYTLNVPHPSYIWGEACVKGGQEKETTTTNGVITVNGVECWLVSGLGTGTATVTKVGSGRDCPDISHVSFQKKLIPTPPDCDVDEIIVDGQCVPPPPPTCEEDEILVGNECVPPPPPFDACPNLPNGPHPVVPAGYMYDGNGNCILIPPPPCDEGEVRVDGQCVPEEPECPEGTTEVNGECEPNEPECEEGEVLVDGQCVPEEPECPEGNVVIDGECVPPPPVCDEGEVLVDGQCVPEEPECPEGNVVIDGECVEPTPTPPPPSITPTPELPSGPQDLGCTLIFLIEDAGGSVVLASPDGSVIYTTDPLPIEARTGYAVVNIDATTPTGQYGLYYTDGRYIGLLTIGREVLGHGPNTQLSCLVSVENEENTTICVSCGPRIEEVYLPDGRVIEVSGVIYVEQVAPFTIDGVEAQTRETPDGTVYFGNGPTTADFEGVLPTAGRYMPCSTTVTWSQAVDSGDELTFVVLPAQWRSEWVVFARSAGWSYEDQEAFANIAVSTGVGESFTFTPSS